MPIPIAVNGTLMRGLELSPAFVASGASFVKESRTEPAYRIWSIQDRHPAMLRVTEGGAPVAVEIWELPAEEIASLLQREPAGLSIGWVTLEDGERVLGVLGEPWLCEGQKEITEWGGWRAYVDRPSESS